SFKLCLTDDLRISAPLCVVALLNTLSEPPPYFKSLLASSDPQKLPITILSRCLQFLSLLPLCRCRRPPG
ncbi:hypothetical protein, partial [Aeromonas salmonicida]|uniref:hypothetical protein n=1 Tax=Aeromonas salmonicida TaxID=645 RepID=UPI003D31B9F2